MIAVWNVGRSTLGLDIGDVLSVRKDTSSNDPLYTFVDIGAIPFVTLFAVEYGFDRLFVISRIDGDKTYWRRGVETDAWVVRFLTDGLPLLQMGLTDDHFRVCKYAWQKGPICKELAIDMFVDNSSAVLMSIMESSPTTTLMYYDNNPQPRIDTDAFQRKRGYQRMLNLSQTMNSWEHLAVMLGIHPGARLWDQVAALGPPYQPARPDIFVIVNNLLYPLPTPTPSEVDDEEVTINTRVLEEDIIEADTGHFEDEASADDAHDEDEAGADDAHGGLFEDEAAADDGGQYIEDEAEADDAHGGHLEDEATADDAHGGHIDEDEADADDAHGGHTEYGGLFEDEAAADDAHGGHIEDEAADDAHGGQWADDAYGGLEALADDAHGGHTEDEAWADDALGGHIADEARADDAHVARPRPSSSSHRDDRPESDPHPLNPSSRWYSKDAADYNWVSAKRRRAEIHAARQRAIAAGEMEAPPLVTPVKHCDRCGRGQPGSRCPNIMCRPCCVIRQSETGRPCLQLEHDPRI